MGIGTMEGVGVCMIRIRRWRMSRSRGRYRCIRTVRMCIMLMGMGMGMGTTRIMDMGTDTVVLNDESLGRVALDCPDCPEEDHVRELLAVAGYRGAV